MSSGRKRLKNCGRAAGSLALCLITSITPSFFPPTHLKVLNLLASPPQPPYLPSSLPTAPLTRSVFPCSSPPHTSNLEARNSILTALTSSVQRRCSVFLGHLNFPPNTAFVMASSSHPMKTFFFFTPEPSPCLLQNVFVWPLSVILVFALDTVMLFSLPSSAREAF